MLWFFAIERSREKYYHNEEYKVNDKFHFLHQISDLSYYSLYYKNDLLKKLEVMKLITSPDVILLTFIFSLMVTK